MTTKVIEYTLEYWAEKQPDAPAIYDENGNKLTWKEWNDQANILAEMFSRKGVSKGDIVAMKSKTRIEWFIINRALTKLGCYLLPINWRLTIPEVKFILKDSKASVFIFDNHNDESYSPLWNEYHLPLTLKLSIGYTNEITGVERYEDLIMNEVEIERMSERVGAEMILYTSGTTGFPKGVEKNVNLLMNNMKEVLEYQQSMREMRGAKHGDRTLITVPLHHGTGPASAETAHRNGNIVVLSDKFEPEKTLRLIDQYKITDWTAVPTMIKRIAALPKETINKYDLSSIKSLVLGAAPVPLAMKEWVLENINENCLYEGYGSTEVGLVSLLTPEMQKKKPLSCGYPYKHVYISVRDDEGNELPPGEVGELWIKTPVTIDRYLNQERLGADTIDESGYFRVGDMGYVDEDGYLYISDRKKDMIISGGVNIYPAEIEAVIIRHDAVQDVAVIGIPNEEFGEEVKAFIELKDGKLATEEEIKKFSSNYLATFKRPRSIEFVKELPRNTAEKILKRVLRDPFWEDKERNV